MRQSVTLRLANSWIDLGTRKKAWAITALPVACFFIILLIPFHQGRVEREMQAWAGRSQDVQRSSQQLVIELMSAENAVDAYVLSGQKAALAPLSHARREAEVLSAHLRLLVSSTPAQERRAILIGQQAGKVLQSLAEMTAASRGAAASRVLSNRRDIRRVRLATDDFCKAESRLLLERSEKVKASNGRVGMLFLVCVLLGTVGGLIATSRFSHNISHRLRLLADVADGLNQGHTIPVTATARDEIGQLHRALYEASASITDREERLGESEARFRGVAQSCPDAIVLADQDGNIVYWNRAAESMFGHPPEEVVGQSLESAADRCRGL